MLAVDFYRSKKIEMHEISLFKLKCRRREQCSLITIFRNDYRFVKLLNKYSDHRDFLTDC